MIATVGTFDGVHIGHRYLLEQLCREGRDRGLSPLAVTFDRHPLSLVNPESTPPVITDVDEQSDAMRALGVRLLRVPFTPELRAMTGHDFLSMLHDRHGVKALMIGFNNHLGCDRDRSPEVDGVELVHCAELPEHSGVSSSMIRTLIANGAVDQAALLLGRPFTISGTVVSGRQLGRRLGFPTANVGVAPDHVMPAPGVYAATVGDYPAVVNVGRRPTVDHPDAPLSVEAHLIGFSGNLYNSYIRIEFISRLRAERRFNSLEELRDAIAADIDNALSVIR
ncbi:MAG: riboflavin biosynthesis protein RibF [Muribaculaceae bacterium]|nr:riboflavin biosynthesis protein RibF [Muribaculaceae bacterium]